MDDFSLQGKHILVTGASSGIGREAAIRINKAGARICAVARREHHLKELMKELCGENAYVVFDLEKTEQIEEMIKKLVSEYGKFDGLMFCAGIAEHVPMKLSKPAYIEKIMRINFFSFAETLRVISNARNCNDGASFIGMSSISGMKGDKGLYAYSSSKAAMNGAIHCGAVELAKRKIRVNGIATGYIGGTELFDRVNERLGIEVVEEFAGENQLFGIGEPKDIANAAVYLLSDASKYITGTIMQVDGGYMA